MPIMLNNLSRLGLANQASLDGRVLAVDMAATLYWWDRKAAEEKVDDGSQPADMVVREDNDPAADAKRQLRLTPAMDESIMNFLLRMAFVR